MQKGGEGLTLLELALGLVDPFLRVSPRYKKRLVQAEGGALRLALFQFPLWVLYIGAAYFTNDAQKVPREPWLYARFVFAGAAAFVGLLAYVFRSNLPIVKLALVILAAMLAIEMSYIMQLGYPIRSQWVSYFPAIVLATTCRSFVVAALVQAGIVFSLMPLWGPHHNYNFVLTELQVTMIGLLFVSFFRMLWVSSLVIKMRNDELEMEKIEQQKIFDAQIRSFISPVLMSAIDRSRNSGYSDIAAINQVLYRTQTVAAVMFSDFRNFSAQADERDFIENKLIPSSAAIIDAAEENMGVAKQIGDAVLVYYSLQDPEESLLRALKDSVEGTIREAEKTEMGTTERYFSVAYGNAHIGNMASVRHREPTIIGSPANLAQRIDNLSKETPIRNFLERSPAVLLSEQAGLIAKSFAEGFEFELISLESLGLSIRSFPNEKNIFTFSISTTNIENLNALLQLNGIPRIRMRVS